MLMLVKDTVVWLLVAGREPDAGKGDASTVSDTVGGGVPEEPNTRH